MPGLTRPRLSRPVQRVASGAVTIESVIGWAKLSAFLGVAVLVTGCDPGYATFVENRSGALFIVRAEDEYDSFASPRYYVVPPGASVLIDTIGHQNPALATVTIMTPDCRDVEDMGGSYQEGGTVTIAQDGSVEFERERTVPSIPRGPDEIANSRPTCEEIAAELPAN